MLKNKNNARCYVAMTMTHSMCCALSVREEAARVSKALRFIEQCSLKIVKINVEAF